MYLKFILRYGRRVRQELRNERAQYSLEGERD